MDLAERLESLASALADDDPDLPDVSSGIQLVAADLRSVAAHLRTVAANLDRRLANARDMHGPRIPSHHVEDARNRIRQMADRLDHD